LNACAVAREAVPDSGVEVARANSARSFLGAGRPAPAARREYGDGKGVRW